MSSQTKQSPTDILKQARQQLYMTEEIAKDTLNTLQIQHNQLVNIKSSLNQTNEELSLSDRFLRRMSQFWRR
jgi:hypothetical protein